MLQQPRWKVLAVVGYPNGPHYVAGCTAIKGEAVEVHLLFTEMHYMLIYFHFEGVTGYYRYYIMLIYVRGPIRFIS